MRVRTKLHYCRLIFLALLTAAIALDQSDVKVIGLFLAWAIFAGVSFIVEYLEEAD